MAPFFFFAHSGVARGHITSPADPGIDRFCLLSRQFFGASLLGDTTLHTLTKGHSNATSDARAAHIGQPTLIYTRKTTGRTEARTPQFYAADPFNTHTLSGSSASKPDAEAHRDHREKDAHQGPPVQRGKLGRPTRALHPPCDTRAALAFRSARAGSRGLYPKILVAAAAGARNVAECISDAHAALLGTVQRRSSDRGLANAHAHACHTA